ncbi:histamine H2 receptor-like [Exaiptasia diaphana]|uniref:G-protein coupled receptors family 1 profile domain-containing protein n=1 Tax=Exaiptasia diaphana TaxID=2652724 RepID=A0A913Y272_EXADI|nr:histamine H2 receptor-like [Exaiptasia diaphana]
MTAALKYEDIPLLLLSIFAVLANIFVCFLVLNTRRLRSATNKFVVSLAISDILIAGLLLPFILAKVDAIVIDYMGSISLLAGVANIAVITIDRYIAVFNPFKYNAIMRKWLVRTIILIWTLSIVISLLPLIWSTNQSSTQHHVYIFTVQIGLVILSYALIFMAYYKIFRKVRQTVRKERTLMMSLAVSRGHGGKQIKVCPSASESKVTRVSVIIALNFMLTWLPVEYMTLVHTVGMPGLIPLPLPKISLFTIALGALIDPVVYSYLKADFRHAIKRMFKKFRRYANSDQGETSASQSMMGGYKYRVGGYNSTNV